MAQVSKLPKIERSVSLASISEFAKQLDGLAEELRDQILAPRPRKVPPTFTSTQVAEMCGIDRARLNYLATREGSTLPPGELQGNGRSRVFTLKETREWVRQASGIHHPENSLPLGKILLTANFKGGSTKTTTCMSLAQGLSLRGRRVLVVDLDPQASLSELCGLYAEKEISSDDTVLPFIYSPNEVGDLGYAIQETYWDGLDVIPAHPALFDAEFHIPSRVSKNSSFKFWALLRQGLNPLRERYDYIILDTAPSLSYLTLNALLAADAMIMPLVPESLDFISSVSFWNLFSDLATSFIKLEGEKQYDFISILLSKVDYSPTSAAPVVRSWVQRAYGDWLHSIEIPASSVASSGALAFSTVYDIAKWEGNLKTLQRIRAPLDAYCQWIDDMYVEKRRAS